MAGRIRHHSSSLAGFAWRGFSGVVVRGSCPVPFAVGLGVAAARRSRPFMGGCGLAAHSFGRRWPRTAAVAAENGENEEKFRTGRILRMSCSLAWDVLYRVLTLRPTMSCSVRGGMVVGRPAFVLFPCGGMEAGVRAQRATQAPALRCAAGAFCPSRLRLLPGTVSSADARSRLRVLVSGGGGSWGLLREFRAIAIGGRASRVAAVGGHACPGVCAVLVVRSRCAIRRPGRRPARGDVIGGD